MAPQFFQHVPRAASIFMSTENGLVDVRLVLEGAELIWAVKLDSVQGETIKDKHKHLLDMSAPTFLQLVASHGFAFVGKAGCCVALPPTCAYLITNAKNDAPTHGLRWQILGSDARAKETIDAIDKTLAAYPNLSEGPLSLIKKAAMAQAST